MSVISAEILKQRQALPLELKVIRTKQRIREWYEHWQGDVYLSFSGGKDSTVLLDIVKGIYPDVPAVFCDTGLEYPEVREFATSNADVVIKPDMNFKQVIEKFGYPFPSKEQALYIRQYRHSTPKMRKLRWDGNPLNGRFCIAKRWRYLVDSPFEFSEQCCDVMKKRPFKKFEREKKLKPMIATMAEESRLRFQEYLQHGCNSFDAKRVKSTPLGFWTEDDVLGYLHETGIDYAKCYGEIVDEGGRLRVTGTKRTGCMFCLFGIYAEHEPNRMQRMQRDYPKQHSYCIEKLGIGKVLDYVGIPYKYQPTLFDAHAERLSGEGE